MFTKLKRSPVPVLPEVTEIRENVVGLIDGVTLGDVDGLGIFLRPDMLRVSLSNLQ